jgi:hypothetical protein
MTPDGYSETMNEIAFPDRIRLLPLKVQDEIADYVDFLFSKYSGKDAIETPEDLIVPAITIYEVYRKLAHEKDEMYAQEIVDYMKTGI